MTRTFVLANSEDEYERRWWPEWIEAHFPSYETFWVRRVVPVTGRAQTPPHLRFLTDSDVKAAGFTVEDVAIAQLHYTVVRHLGRVFEQLDDARAFTTTSYLANPPFGSVEFFEAFTRLSGVSDVADELLGRRSTPGAYDPWNERHGADARRAWRSAGPDPLEPVRAYRNRLVHGRFIPEVYLDLLGPHGRAVGQTLLYPRLKRVDSYLDWRTAFKAAEQKNSVHADFDEARLIAADAWERTVAYVETAWREHLLS